MGNRAVINAIGISEYAVKPLADGRTPVSVVTEYARSLPEVGSLVYLSDGAFGEALSGGETVHRDDWTTSSLIETLTALSKGFDHLFYVFADCPLLDLELSRRMYGNHLRYYAQYTFADGFPYGLSPEILRGNALGQIAALASGDSKPPARDSIFTVVQKDINAFDLETELSPKDLRLLRVSLSCDTRRNRLLAERVMEAGGRDGDSVLRVLESRPEILRTLPAFANVQIVDGCPHSCSYCPYPLFGGDILENSGYMESGAFERLVDSISGFCGDAVISVSLWGEPSRHPEFSRLAKAVAGRPGLSLVIETSGIGWDREVLDGLHGLRAGSLTWVVSMDADNEGDYRTLRGEGWSEAKDTAELLLGMWPRNTYVQAVRMKESDQNLERFYRGWFEKTENVIVQKYDDFCGVLPDRKVTDLSPLNRFPCWHVKRDLTVLMDGTVVLCREDIRRQHVLGNAFTQPLEEIWDAGDTFHRRHIAGTYPDLC